MWPSGWCVCGVYDFIITLFWLLRVCFSVQTWDAPLGSFFIIEEEEETWKNVGFSWVHNMTHRELALWWWMLWDAELLRAVILHCKATQSRQAIRIWNDGEISPEWTILRIKSNQIKVDPWPNESAAKIHFRDGFVLSTNIPSLTWEFSSPVNENLKRVFLRSCLCYCFRKFPSL